jgi:hypothetical protein
MNVNNPQHKLSEKEVASARRFFEDEGWRIFWIANYFHINHRAIYFYMKSYGWVRKVKILKRMPEEVADVYRERRKEKNRTRVLTYDEIRQESAERHLECEHGRWIRRCSLCGKILGSDATH